MPIKPPAYPETLTHKHWNKKKGIVARMKNDVETGIGRAADTAQALCAKIDWNKLNYNSIRATGTFKTVDDIDVAVEDIKKYYKSAVQPAKLAVETLARNAKEAVAPLKTSNYKDAAKAAEAIAKDAVAFALALAPNSEYFDEMWELVKEHKNYLTTKGQMAKDALDKDPKKLLDLLLKGVKGLADLPGPKPKETDAAWRNAFTTYWGKNIKNQGRNVGNLLKISTDPVVLKHVKLLNNKYIGFSHENMDLFRDVNNLSPAELMKRADSLLKAVEKDIDAFVRELN